jgi:hypothetical protein
MRSERSSVLPRRSEHHAFGRHHLLAVPGYAGLLCSDRGTPRTTRARLRPIVARGGCGVTPGTSASKRGTSFRRCGGRGHGDARDRREPGRATGSAPARHRTSASQTRSSDVRSVGGRASIGRGTWTRRRRSGRSRSVDRPSAGSPMMLDVGRSRRGDNWRSNSAGSGRAAPAMSRRRWWRWYGVRRPRVQELTGATGGHEREVRWRRWARGEPTEDAVPERA